MISLKLFLNIGEKDNFKIAPWNLIKMDQRFTKRTYMVFFFEFGKIDVQLGRKFYFYGSREANMSKAILGALNVSEFDGRKVVGRTKNWWLDQEHLTDQVDRHLTDQDKKRGSGFKKRPSCWWLTEKSGGKSGSGAGSGGRRK